MKLSTKIETFVAHFGEMGSRWGFNRTVGQMYALLLIYNRPLNADEIAEMLSISRSNVSMGIKELQSWRLLNVKHYPGDRKDYFYTPEDIVEIARIVVEERHKREIAPTLSMLRDEIMREPDTEEGKYAQQRMTEMYDLMEKVSEGVDELSSLSTKDLNKMIKMGSSVASIFSFKDKLMGKSNDKDDT
ncbi:MAG: GbsR/MarR family transcriptional regulator [Leucothrix sp.]